MLIKTKNNVKNIKEKQIINILRCFGTFCELSIMFILSEISDLVRLSVDICYINIIIRKHARNIH